MTLKMAVLAPMPRPSVRMKARENPGMRGSVRSARRRSLITGDPQCMSAVARLCIGAKAGGVGAGLEASVYDRGGGVTRGAHSCVAEEGTSRALPVISWSVGSLLVVRGSGP